MTRHHPDLGRASDWLKQIFRATRPIRSTNQIWVVMRHQYGISALVSHTLSHEMSNLNGTCLKNNLNELGPSASRPASNATEKYE